MERLHRGVDLSAVRNSNSGRGLAARSSANAAGEAAAAAGAEAAADRVSRVPVPAGVDDVAGGSPRSEPLLRLSRIAAAMAAAKPIAMSAERETPLG